MLLTIYVTKWPILCCCAVKKLLTHSLPSRRPTNGDKTLQHQFQIVYFRDRQAWPEVTDEKCAEIKTKPEDRSLLRGSLSRLFLVLVDQWAEDSAMPWSQSDRSGSTVHRSANPAGSIRWSSRYQPTCWWGSHPAKQSTIQRSICYPTLILQNRSTML